MKKLILAFICLFLAIPCQAQVIYVDADANGANDGSSWADAYTELQSALDEAAPDDQIRVAEETYLPDYDVSTGTHTGSRTATFQLINGVAIYGGYAGFSAPDPNVCDPNAYETILSGDINTSGDNSDNSYHVVTGSGCDANAILDGFTITAGNANGDWQQGYYGGGGFCNWYGTPKITNCTFKNNNGGNGGGMRNAYGNATVIDCTFIDNSTISEGGAGIINVGCSPAINSCRFINNISNNNGGGIFNTNNSNPEISNCTFSGNSAVNAGGGIGNNNSAPTVINCILWGNSDGGGTDESAQIHGGIPVVNYCCIQGLTGSLGGIGNIDADPCFVDPDNGDYHLKSEGWSWDIKRNRWTYDDVTSRCIDAGNPGSPLGDELLSVPDDPNNIWGENLRINMGAYGGTAEASIPPYDWAILADLTNDGKVDLNDLAAFVNYWLDSGECIPSDLNRSQFIDLFDFALLAQDWLKQTTWHE